MAQETELQIDDGLTVTTVSLQCGSCEDQPYLDRSDGEVTKTAVLSVKEYAFTCPNVGKGCATRVLIRTRLDGTA